MQRRAQHGTALFTHRLLFRVALGAGNVFAWMFVYRAFFLATHHLEVALAGTAALYVLSQVVAFFLTPLSGMALRHGVRRALIIGTLLTASSFAFLAVMFLDTMPLRSYVFGAITAFAILHGIARALYWVPYSTARADLLEQSPGVLLREALVALMPAGAGYLVTMPHGPVILFGGAALILFLATIPLARMREKYEQFDWSYVQTFRHFTSRGNNLAVGLFILDGIQGAALLLVWPLAAFLVLGNSFRALGAILAATLCIAFLGRYLVRHALRFLRVHRSPGVLATIVFSSWIVRLAAGSPVQILAVDLLYNCGTQPRRFSIDSYAAEQNADGGHYVDEYTAIKEMGLAVGRIAVCLLFILLVLTTAESLAFAATILTAAVAAAWSVFLANKLEKVAY